MGANASFFKNVSDVCLYSGEACGSGGGVCRTGGLCEPLPAPTIAPFVESNPIMSTPPLRDIQTSNGRSLQGALAFAALLAVLVSCGVL